MSRIDNRKLINLGRKSGLSTTDIYRALASRPEASDLGSADSNGFVPTLDCHGHVAWLAASGRDAEDAKK